MDPRILQIETWATHAWPARENVPLDGWMLRAHPAPSRRVNSVWPNGWEGRIPLARKLEMVESHYAERNQPARYQVCPAALPPGLDDVLEARGYRLDAPTSVQTAAAASVIQSELLPAEVAVETFFELGMSWVEAYCRAQNAPETQIPVRFAALERITQPVCYVLARIDGQAAAVGRGVFEDGWMGIFGMATHPDYRRRGLATTVLRVLAACAIDRGASDLYLQVMENNLPALTMYAGLGFETLYRYHYRFLETGLPG